MSARRRKVLETRPATHHLLGMIVGLLIPAVVIGIAALLVTRMVERALPETIAGIALTALLAGLALWLLSALLFAALYLAQAPGAAQLIRHGGTGHFATLGLKAALIWGPVLTLVVTTAPRRWRTNVW